MSDFKSYIKQKYQAEVNPQYTDQAWEKFATASGFIENKKKRRILPFFLFGAIAISLILFTYLNISSQRNINPIKDNYKENPINNIIPAIAKTTEIQVPDDSNTRNGAQSVINNNKNSNVKTTPYSKGLSKNKLVHDPSMLSGDPISDTQETVVNEEMVIEEKTNIEVMSINEQLITEERTTLSFESLTSYMPLLKTEFTLLAGPQNSIIPVHRINDTPWSIELMGGVGQQFHRSIKNQELWLISSGVNYQLFSHLKVKSIIGINKSSFYSRVLNRNLGLRSINYPDRQARFSQVQSTASYFEAGLGVDFLTGSYNGFSAQVGPAILVVKELQRTLVYDFNSGGESIQDVRAADSTAGLHPYYMVVNAGLNYEWNPLFSLVLRGEYFFTTSTNESQLQDQLRLKLGISKKF